MFVFEDISKLNDRKIQMLLKTWKARNGPWP